MGEPHHYRPWATGGLPADIEADIVSLLPCRADRRNMAAVCRAWRDLIQRFHAACPPPLPWLLVPGGESARVHCSLSNYGVHRHIGSRYFGSHDGAWVFLACYAQTCSYMLLNLRDGRVIRLPDVVQRGEVEYGMAMLAATVSAPPDDPNCIGACIYTRGPDIPGLRRVAFWRMGSRVAHDLEIDQVEAPQPGWPTPAEFEVEDIVYSGGDQGFVLLTRGEHTITFAPILAQEGDEVLLYPDVVFGVDLFEQPGARDYGGLVVIGRYLIVAEQGELLMVVRLSHPDQIMTSSFRVFQEIPPPDGDGEEEEDEEQGEEVGDQEAEEEEEDEEQGEEVSDQDEEEEDEEQGEEDEYASSWGELNTLDGRMLFVGRGCSRSYQVANYPNAGLTAGVYFSDDLTFYNAGMMFRAAHDRQYPCSDNGKWSEGPPPVVMRCPPENLSRHSSPTWVLP